VLWLEWIGICEAALQLGLAAANGGHFFAYARQASLAARRVAAAALSLINVALALEAGVFLLLRLGDPSITALLDSGPVLFLRTLLLLAVAFISLLIWRARRHSSG
jgi:hypothetical protein